MHKISSEYSLEEELTKLIEKNMILSQPKTTCKTVPKKNLYIRLPFTNDAAGEILQRKLNAAAKRTYFAAKMKVIFYAQPMVVPQLIDKLPTMTTSIIVYDLYWSNS